VEGSGRRRKAWKVPAEQIAKNNYNLDIKNPNSRHDLEKLPPDELVQSIVSKEEKIVRIINEIKQLLAEEK
jgi:type I restriction enzyme M protein